MMEANWGEINKRVAEVIRKYGGEVREEGAVGILWIEKQPDFPKKPGEFEPPVRIDMRNFGGEYMLAVSVVSTDYDLTGVNVLLSGLEMAKKIMEEAYEGRYEELQKCIEEEWKARRRAEEEHKRQLVEEFNKLPKVLREWTYGEHVKIVLERSDAEYVPTKSDRILGNVYIKLYVDGAEKHFWFGNYITSDGKIQKKKFLIDSINITTDNRVAEWILGDLKSIIEAREYYIHKYELRC